MDNQQFNFNNPNPADNTTPAGSPASGNNAAPGNVGANPNSGINPNAGGFNSNGFPNTNTGNINANVNVDSYYSPTQQVAANTTMPAPNPMPAYQNYPYQTQQLPVHPEQNNNYYPTPTANQNPTPPSPEPPTQYTQPNTPTPARNKSIPLIAILIALSIILTGSLIYFFKDKIFDSPSYANGIKTSWTIELPSFNGSRYVEPVSEDKLLLVNIDEKQQTQGFYINISKQKTQDPKQTSKAALEKVELPKCDTNTPRPYTIKNGKPTCNQYKPKTIKAKDIHNLKGKQNSFWDMNIVGKIDNVTIAHTNPKYSPFLTVGISEDNNILWAKTYKDQAPGITINENKILAAGKNGLTEFEPATKTETQNTKEITTNTNTLTTDLLSAPNYKAYKEYLKLITQPNESESSNDNYTKTTYSLAKIDKSGIPALLVSNFFGLDGALITRHVNVYLYKSDTGKIIKSDKPLLYGGSFVLKGTVYVSKAEYGLFNELWGGFDPYYVLYQEKDGKITQTKKIPQPREDGVTLLKNSMTQIPWYDTTDTAPLKEALKINDDILNGNTKTSTDNSDKDAIKKVDFENMTLHSTAALGNELSSCRDESIKNHIYPLQGGKCQIILKNGKYETKTDYGDKREITIHEKHYQDLNGDGYLDTVVIYHKYLDKAAVPDRYLTTVWITDPDNPKQPLGYFVDVTWNIENLKINSNGFSYTKLFETTNGPFSCKISGSAKNPKFDIQGER